MDETVEREPDSYEAKLKGEFDRCDATKRGALDRKSLQELFTRLELDPFVSQQIECALIKGNKKKLVTFPEFLSSFVEVLSGQDIGSNDDDVVLSSSPAYEMSSKFLLQTKKNDDDDCESFMSNPNNPGAATSERGVYSRHTSRDDSEEFEDDDPTEMFSILDPEKKGWCNYNSLVEFWEAGGLSCPGQLLTSLGFTAQSRVDLTQLSSTLLQEVQDLTTDGHVSGHSLMQALLIIYQAHLKQFRINLKQMEHEREKLQGDILDANQRATMLAQEVDEHYARLENTSQTQLRELEERYMDQVKQLQDSLHLERESANSKIQQNTIQCQEQLEHMQDNENLVKQQLDSLQSEVSRLEQENQEHVENLLLSEKNYQLLQKEVEELKNNLCEFETNEELQEGMRLTQLMDQLQKVAGENIELRDRNDELILQVESLKKKKSGTKNKKKSPPVSSWLSDSSGGSLKRRGIKTSSCGEESSEEDSPRSEKCRKYSRTDFIVAYADESIHDITVGPESLDLDVEDMEKTCTDVPDIELDMDPAIEKNLQSPLSSLPPEGNPAALELSKVFNVLKRQMRDDLEQDMDEVELVRCVLEDQVRSLEHKCEELEKQLCIMESDYQNTIKQHEKQIKKIQLQMKDKEELKCYDAKNVTPVSEDTEKNLLKSSHIQNHVLMPQHSRSQSDSLVEMKMYSTGSTTHSESLYKSEKNLASKVDIPEGNFVTSPWESTKFDATKKLEQHCKNLKGELETVKVEIVRILAEKDLLYKENINLKGQLIDSESDVGKKREELKKCREKLLLTEDEKRQCNQRLAETEEVCQKLQSKLKSETVKSNQEIEALQENAKDFNDACLEKSNESSTDDLKTLKMQLQDARNDLTREKAKYKTEQTNLTERCSNLESSLELMRVEYERSEEYWTTKLEEERQFWEESQKMTDKRYNELESQIKEYECLLNGGKVDDDNEIDLRDMVGAGLENDKIDSDMLSDIEERASLENQVTDLEDECTALQQRVNQIQGERDSVETYWQNRLQEETRLLESQVKKLTQRQSDLEWQLGVAQTKAEKTLMDLDEEKSRTSKLFSELEHRCREKQDELQRLRPQIAAECEAKWKEKLDKEKRELEALYFHDVLGQNVPENLHNGFSDGTFNGHISLPLPSSSPQVVASPFILQDVRILQSLRWKLKAECDRLQGQKDKLLLEQWHTSRQRMRTVSVENVAQQPRPNSVAGCTPRPGQVEHSMVQVLTSRLQQQEQCCQQLQVALRHQQQQTERILAETRQQHQQEICNMETVMSTTQQMLQDQIQKYKEQSDKLTCSDLLVHELYVENAHLMKAVQQSSQHHRPQRPIQQNPGLFSRMMSSRQPSSSSIPPSNVRVSGNPVLRPINPMGLFNVYDNSEKHGISESSC